MSDYCDEQTQSCPEDQSTAPPPAAESSAETAAPEAAPLPPAPALDADGGASAYGGRYDGGASEAALPGGVAEGPAEDTVADPIHDQPPPKADRDRELSETDKQEMVEDRKQARDELRGKFDVVPDDHAGERAPNQVTEAELAQIAATYSDIRRGKSDLQVDIDSPSLTDDQKQAARDKIMDDVGTIMQTRQGRETIGRLTDNENDKQTTIGLSHENAYRPGGRDPACDVPAAPADSHQDPTSPVDKNNATTIGDGKTEGEAQNARVRYAPGEQMDLPAEGGRTHAADSHVVLYHELAHADDYTHGKIDRAPITAGDPVDRQGYPDPCNPTGRVPVDKAEESALERERQYRDERRQLGEDVPDRPRYYGGDPGNRPRP